MARPFRTALVVLAVIGSLALGPGSAFADDVNLSPNSGGASGCCRITIN